MTIKYIVAVQNETNLVIAVGIADDQCGMDYPIQGEPKLGKWATQKFDTCPSCNSNQHIELIDGVITVVDDQ